MKVMFNKEKTELTLLCNDGCDSGIHFIIDKDFEDYYCIASVLNGAFYSEQGETIFRIIKKKIKKIIAVLFNKDFYYSEIIMSKDDFEDFKKFINNVSEENK